ncbi:MAG: hypothetical protein ACLU99_03280 [Alphaproteobacteria bacterium]
MFLQRHRYSVLFTAVVLLAWIISTPLPRLGKINLYGFDNPPRIGEAITYPETVSFCSCGLSLCKGHQPVRVVADFSHQYHSLGRLFSAAGSLAEERGLGR